ncbi:MAG: rRNA pseudouridine synthase [Saccharofermentans sp.]|nr:rRNA pseudouridine synthase [Saccharofermentans sp.]
MRLDKTLANSGYGTRTEVKSLISKGQVHVNGVMIKDPGFHVKDEDTITIGGNSTSIKDKFYLLLDKPDGVLTAMEDKRLPHVGELLPSNLKNKKISPVGRLDFHTTGLLILTNDGELSHRLTSPNYGISKTYEVTYEGDLLTDKEALEASSGMVLLDKEPHIKLRPSTVVFDNGTNTARITLSEGKTHEVRRIFAQWNRPVITLRRVSLGPISLEEKPQEMLRELTDDEVKSLKEITGLV